MPSLTYLDIESNASPAAPAAEPTCANIEIVNDNIGSLGDILEQYVRRYFVPNNVNSYDFADYHREFLRAIDRTERLVPISTPFSERIGATGSSRITLRPSSPMRHYRTPVWAITPERTELGYMAHNRVAPWGGGESTFYSSDLPDHGDRVFPVAKRRGDMYLPLAWPTSKMEARA